MMAAIFAALLAALGIGWFGSRRLALACAALAFGLAVWLFLWEVWSPEYGFRMPWIDVRLPAEASDAPV
ncbi:hypothetical protein [uncultured Amaricoccus sp.]|uniref:hypothetical protein n=1 Tax=uncultured Amaricoccus sp. TaxID=339341 RepID=UPI002624AB4C|nr:hypothetical protein [uncultured Amaricoccus sp.]